MLSPVLFVKGDGLVSKEKWIVFSLCGISFSKFLLVKRKMNLYYYLNN